MESDPPTTCAKCGVSTSDFEAGYPVVQNAALRCFLSPPSDDPPCAWDGLSPLTRDDVYGTRTTQETPP